MAIVLVILKCQNARVFLRGYYFFPAYNVFLKVSGKQLSAVLHIPIDSSLLISYLNSTFYIAQFIFSKLWVLRCWRRLESPWTARRSNKSILTEINPGISLEEMMLKLKLLYFGHLMRRVDSLEKTLMDWGQEEKGTTEDEMAGWHHWLDGCESEWNPGVGDGQGGLACCNSWSSKESDTTERLNLTKLDWWMLLMGHKCNGLLSDI